MPDHENCKVVFKSWLIFVPGPTGPPTTTKILYFTNRSVTPFMSSISKKIGEITLRDFKVLFDRPGFYRFHFKSVDQEFGMVKEEVRLDLFFTYFENFSTFSFLDFCWWCCITRSRWKSCSMGRRRLVTNKYFLTWKPFLRHYLTVHQPTHIVLFNFSSIYTCHCDK